MNSLLDEDDDREEASHRELTLSTGAILAVFLGLVLLCGAFFGFGYKMGSHKPAPILAAEPPSNNTDFSNFRPAGNISATPPSSPKPNAGTNPSMAGAVPPPAPTPQPDPSPPPAESHTAPRPTSAPAAAHPAPPPPAARTPAPVAIETAASVPSGSFIVQIAAISPTHQSDADMLVAALRAKGYPATARSEPQDRLLHIQVGPYKDHKEAEAIKLRLSVEGYNNPIVK